MKIVRSQGPLSLFDADVTNEDLLEAIEDPDAKRKTAPEGSNIKRVLGTTKSGKALEVMYVESGDISWVSYGSRASEEDWYRWASEN